MEEREEYGRGDWTRYTLCCQCRGPFEGPTNLAKEGIVMGVGVVKALESQALIEAGIPPHRGRFSTEPRIIEEGLVFAWFEGPSASFSALGRAVELVEDWLNTKLSIHRVEARISFWLLEGHVEPPAMWMPLDY